MTSIEEIEEHLRSPNKAVRLKALKLLLGHPDATPLQLVRALCSDDNRNGEFMNVFGMHGAVRGAWPRLAGVDDDEIYAYLEELVEEGSRGVQLVAHILECIGTERALEWRIRLRWYHWFP